MSAAVQPHVDLHLIYGGAFHLGTVHEPCHGKKNIRGMFEVVIRCVAGFKPWKLAGKQGDNVVEDSGYKCKISGLEHELKDGLDFFQNPCRDRACPTSRDNCGEENFSFFKSVDICCPILEICA